MSLYDVDKLMAEARRLAAQYRRATGKPLPISGEIAVHDALRLLQLRPAPRDTAGYDAIGTGEREGLRIQVKGRAVMKEKVAKQRLGQLRMEQDWDVIMLVIMDDDYEPTEIWEADREEIAEAQDEADQQNKRGAMSLAKFKAIGRLAWTREEGVVVDEVWDNQTSRSR